MTCSLPLPKKEQPMFYLRLVPFRFKKGTTYFAAKVQKFCDVAKDFFMFFNMFLVTA